VNKNVKPRVGRAAVDKSETQNSLGPSNMPVGLNLELQIHVCRGRTGSGRVSTFQEKLKRGEMLKIDDTKK
jgi:hypothetical protein